MVRDMMMHEVEQELEEHEYDHYRFNVSSGGTEERTPRESVWTDQDEIVALLKQKSNWTTDTLRGMHLVGCGRRRIGGGGDKGGVRDGFWGCYWSYCRC